MANRLAMRIAPALILCVCFTAPAVVYHLAKRLVKPVERAVFDVPLVPLLVYVQKLARLRPKGDSTVGSNMILGKHA